MNPEEIFQISLNSIEFWGTQKDYSLQSEEYKSKKEMEGLSIEINTLKEENLELKSNLLISKQKLNSKETELENIKRELSKLQEKYNEKGRENFKLEEMYNTMKKKVNFTNKISLIQTLK
jgi:chromosome segregation ATPase